MAFGEKRKRGLMRFVLHILAFSFVLAALASCSRDARSSKRVDAPPTMSNSSPPGEAAQSISAVDPYQDIPLLTPVMHRTQAGEPDADGWCHAASTRGSFSVTLPGPFTDYMLKSTTTTGGVGVFHTVATKDASGTEFNVLQTECIGKRPPATLSRVESLKDRFEKVGAAVEHRDFTIDGLPADRLSVCAPGVSAEMVLVSRGSSDYMISVQWRGHAAETLDQDIERFLASFRFTAPDHRNLAN
jgi:hypothetical protein